MCATTLHLNPGDIRLFPEKFLNGTMDKIQVVATFSCHDVTKLKTVSTVFW